MKLKITITGPKVHDVGYRYLLMSMAMAKRIRMFEAHNTESIEGEEVLVFVDGGKVAVEAFHALVETKRPDLSEVSRIQAEDCDGEIMTIGEYAQFCTTIQMNKAIPVLLEIRDDIKETKGDIKEMKGDIKETKGDIREMKGDIKEMKGDIKETKGDIREMKGDMKEMKNDMKAVRENTDAITQIHEEIKGLKEEVQPGITMQLRQMQSDIRAIKGRLGMP